MDWGGLNSRVSRESSVCVCVAHIEADCFSFWLGAVGEMGAGKGVDLSWQGASTHNPTILL